MKLVLFAFFAAFIATVYGTTEYLVSCGLFKPESGDFAEQSFMKNDGNGDFFYIGFQQGNQCRRFVKHETKGNWFQIAVKSEKLSSVLKLLNVVEYEKPYLTYISVLLLNPSEKIGFGDEKTIYFKDVKGILYGYDGKHLDRLCYSNIHGLHFESTQTYHPRFYLTIEGNDIVKAGDADKRVEPIDKTILDDFHFEKHEPKSKKPLGHEREIKPHQLSNHKEFLRKEESGIEMVEERSSDSKEDLEIYVPQL